MKGAEIIACLKERGEMLENFGREVWKT